MKKRLFLVIAVVMILTIVLAGCNLFTVNAERDGDQVVATVKYKGLVAEVTKSEFGNYFGQNYAMYNQYFKWTAEEAGENFISILARQKMNVVLAAVKVAEDRGVNIDKAKFNAIVKENVKASDKTKGYGVYSAFLLSLLNPDEQKYVREQTNKLFKDSYDEYIETQLENDRINEKEDEDDTDEDAKEPRPVKDKEEENTEFKADDSVKQEDADSIKDFFTEYKPNENSTQHERDAYKKQERALSDTYLTYEYYLAKQAESRLTAKYQEYFKGTMDGVDVKVNENYHKALQDQIKSNKTASSYKSAIEGGSVVLFHNGRYVKVKSILLQFSDEQKKVLEYYQTKYTGDDFKDFVKDIRRALVLGSEYVDVTMEQYAKELCGLKVYKSNPDYDPKKPAGDPAKKNNEENKDKTDAEMNYPYIPNPDYDPDVEGSDKWLSVPFDEVIAELGAALAEVDATARAEYNEKYPPEDRDDKYAAEDYEVGCQMYINQKRAELFEDWIYLVNDDPGMFEGKEYVGTPVGNSSDYVVEFTALVRQLLLDNGTAGSVMVNTDGAEAGYKNGIVVTKSKVGADEVEIYTDKANQISYIINDFGVHIVMLTTVPVDMGYNQEGVHFTISENEDFDMSKFEDNTDYTAADLELIRKENTYFTFTLDAYVGFDEDEGRATTVRDYYTEQLKSTYDSTAYSNHSKKMFAMYGDKLFDAGDDKEPEEGYANFKFETALNKSVYNSVVSVYKKALK